MERRKRLQMLSSADQRLAAWQERFLSLPEDSQAFVIDILIQTAESELHDGEGKAAVQSMAADITLSWIGQIYGSREVTP